MLRTHVVYTAKGILNAGKHHQPAKDDKSPSPWAQYRLVWLNQGDLAQEKNLLTKTNTGPFSHF